MLWIVCFLLHFSQGPYSRTRLVLLSVCLQGPAPRPGTSVWCHVVQMIRLPHYSLGSDPVRQELMSMESQHALSSPGFPPPRFGVLASWFCSHRLRRWQYCLSSSSGRSSFFDSHPTGSLTVSSWLLQLLLSVPLLWWPSQANLGTSPFNLQFTDICVHHLVAQAGKCRLLF